MALGPVMLDLEGTSLTPEDRELLCHPAVGGVILFSRNYEDPEQISNLTSSIHELRDPHLLVAVDQEGGGCSGSARVSPVCRPCLDSETSHASIQHGHTGPRRPSAG